MCQQTAREDRSSPSLLLCSGAMGEPGRHRGERLGAHMLEVDVDFFLSPFPYKIEKGKKEGKKKIAK